ncbi:MAG: histidine kinase [Dorea sp.]|jgi:hypothetical protein|nr:histidine kinase [Dorea sp.]
MKKRLFIGFFFVSVFPATILFTVIGISFYQKTVRDYKEQAIQISGEMQYRVEGLMGQQAQVLDEFASDPDIVKTIRKMELGAGGTENALLEQQLQIQLLSAVNKGTSHMRTEILNPKGEVIAGIFENYYPDLSDAVKQKVRKMSERSFLWHDRSSVNTGGDVLVLGREIINFFNSTRIGWVVIYRNTEDIRMSLKQMDTNAGMAIYDVRGRLICSPKDLEQGGGVSKIPDEMEGYTDGQWVELEGERVYFRKSDTLNWMLVVFQSQKELRSLIFEMIFYAGAVYILAIGIMMYLVKEVYRAQVKEKEAVLGALEAQINPHFLYNTLDMLNWMAYRSENQDVCKIIRCLSDFFRLSLNRGKEIYTVSDELKHVQCYVTIEQYKKTNVRFSIEADPGIMDCPCPKLIVQPLVENALIHGLEPKKMNGNIWILFKRNDDKIMIRVSDDGAGFTEKSKNANPYEKSGYGLANINERLRMLYGGKCKVELARRDGGGVTASICLPGNIREEHHVSYDSRGRAVYPGRD